jgi:hypothetical protein
MSGALRPRSPAVLVRAVLVWLALFFAAAAASPMVAPQASELVCTAMGGMKMVNVNAGDDAPVPADLECPLCMPVAAPAPPPPAVTDVVKAASAPHPTATAQPIARGALPWQARAPPRHPY